MEQQRSLTPILDFLDPAALDYTQWLQVGMGLKESGYPVSYTHLTLPTIA